MAAALSIDSLTGQDNAVGGPPLWKWTTNRNKLRKNYSNILLKENLWKNTTTHVDFLLPHLWGCVNTFQQSLLTKKWKHPSLNVLYLERATMKLIVLHKRIHHAGMNTISISIWTRCKNTKYKCILARGKSELEYSANAFHSMVKCPNGTDHAVLI